MKNFTLLFVLIICIPFIAKSQTSGVIYYTSVTKLDRPVPENMPEDIKKMIPKERKVNKELYFNETASMFKNGDQESLDDAAFDGNDRARRFRRRFMSNRGDEKTYTSLSTNAKVKTRDIMGKVFLIEDESVDYKWKMTGQKKQILDYLAMEATTMVNDTTIVTAWFTPQIPLSIGPAELGGLPGAILEAFFENGRVTSISVTKVDLRSIEDNELNKPTKGKKVTQEEFDKIRSEKMKERRNSFRAAGQGRFRRGQ